MQKKSRLHTRNKTRRRPGNVKLGRLILGVGDFLFSMNATKKYFGLLISRHVSVADVATSHVPAGYDRIQLPNSTNLPVSASQFVHWLFLTLAKKQTQKRVKTFFLQMRCFCSPDFVVFPSPLSEATLWIAHESRKMESQSCLEFSLCE